MRPATVLVVDDTQPLVRSIQAFLVSLGHKVATAFTCAEARKRMAEAYPEVVLLDLNLPDGNGGELMGELKKDYPDVQFIVITAFGSIRSAVEATRRGAADYLTKPFELEQVQLAIENALRNRLVDAELTTLRARGAPAPTEGEKEAQDYPSSAMRETLQLARHAAAQECNVLVLGESGTGKDHLCRLIHSRSRRASGPYFVLNCAALSREIAESELFGHEPGAFTGTRGRKRGLVELADKGSLLLNEVGELDLALQAKLLSFLDTKTFVRVGGERSVAIDVRIFAATNRDLMDEVSKGRFRLDLYYRLNVLPIRMPPLRERKGDMLALVRDLLGRLSTDLAQPAPPMPTPDALAALEAYSWPGNIRELRNVLERAIITSPRGTLEVEGLRLGDAPASPAGPAAGPQGWRMSVGFPQGQDLHQSLQAVAREIVREALRRAKTRQEAAALLGISRHALAHQLKALGLEE
ncbi:MAG TPA: sigma-54 dependent transcriptional regulator [Myxococcales bacterium]|jgi:DNA-binding NtrC family response regulator